VGVRVARGVNRRAMGAGIMAAPDGLVHWNRHRSERVRHLATGWLRILRKSSQRYRHLPRRILPRGITCLNDGNGVALRCYQEGLMVRNVKLRRMGGSVGATLPKDMAERLHLEAGDEVLAVETANGILLSPYDPDVEEGLNIAVEAQKRYRGALRELAR